MVGERAAALPALHTDFTIDEASAGDPQAAVRRLEWLKGIPLLRVTPQTESLAHSIVKLLRLPAKAAVDALHVAISIQCQMDYLLTWNCTHLANPVLQKELVEFCRYHGFLHPNYLHA
jgi:hypothetical protein